MSFPFQVDGFLAFTKLSSYVTHPIVVSLAVLITFASATPNGYSSYYYRDAFGHSRSLRAWFSEEEARYFVAAQEWLELIKKWGPREDAIDPYPTHGEFYTLCAGLFHSGLPVPHRVQRVGTLGDGGKWVCGLDRVAKQDKCVIYSFGINGESSFESRPLQRAPGYEAWGYGYSCNQWGPEITNDPELRDRAHFKPYALGGTNNHNNNENHKFWTLDSLMDLNGACAIFFFPLSRKTDDFTQDTRSSTSSRNRRTHDVPHRKRRLPVGQLQLEIHACDGRKNFEYFARWWAALEAAGLRPFWTEPNLVYANLVRGVRPELAECWFINIRGDHALVNVNETFNWAIPRRRAAAFFHVS
ncbi:hypothetical protein V8E53_003908 [Lactarius tabidus]